MDKDKVLEIARECGFEHEHYTIVGKLSAFASAIEAATREECAKLCDEVWRESIGIAGASARTAAEAIRNMGKEG